MHSPPPPVVEGNLEDHHGKYPLVLRHGFMGLQNRTTTRTLAHRLQPSLSKERLWCLNRFDHNTTLTAYEARYVMIRVT
ncbi:hypothetical protein NXS19_001829 [Fusarium pseudograminearum]|nr:hypothetical protein NXS19_001829 [Fusarium pseudograminearum]